MSQQPKFKIGDYVGNTTTQATGTVKAIYKDPSGIVYLIGNQYYYTTDNLILIQ
jgi:hypothetical protein